MVRDSVGFQDLRLNLANTQHQPQSYNPKKLNSGNIQSSFGRGCWDLDEITVPSITLISAWWDSSGGFSKLVPGILWKPWEKNWSHSKVLSLWCYCYAVIEKEYAITLHQHTLLIYITHLAWAWQKRLDVTHFTCHKVLYFTNNEKLHEIFWIFLFLLQNW